MLSLLSHVKSCMLSYFIIAKLIIYCPLEYEDWGSVYDYSLAKFSGVTLTQSCICLELKGSEKDIQIYEVSESEVLECTALFSLCHCHLLYCYVFTLFKNSFPAIKTSFVLLKSCAWRFSKCQRWFLHCCWMQSKSRNLDAW